MWVYVAILNMSHMREGLELWVSNQLQHLYQAGRPQTRNEVFTPGRYEAFAVLLCHFRATQMNNTVNRKLLALRERVALL